MTRKRHHPLIAKAIKICGTQAKLAAATRTSQQTICRVLNGQVPVSAELAAQIELVTNGEITRLMLRPDVFFTPIQRLGIADNQAAA